MQMPSGKQGAMPALNNFCRGRLYVSYYTHESKITKPIIAIAVDSALRRAFLTTGSFGTCYGTA
jgi:hypothetical protein